MNYTLSLTRAAYKTLRSHLLHDRHHEQMAITLCGLNRMAREVRLLVRDVILLPPDAFLQQSAAHLELSPDVQAFIHQRAHQHHLIQVDWHSHPGDGPSLTFSTTDDHYEAAQAVYLAHRMDGVPYGSVVINSSALDARLWLTQPCPTVQDPDNATRVYHPEAHPLHTLFAGDLARHIPVSSREQQGSEKRTSPIFDRQVRAFGRVFQRRIGDLRVGVVGLGGMGSALVEYLARLGVRDWALVDPDTVDITNLNRLVNASIADARKRRPKVNVARSTIRKMSPKATVRALQSDVFAIEAVRALKACDLLIAATDNHSSRMALNRLAVQYLIPLIHVGFNISVDVDAQTQEHVISDGAVTDVSGEFAIPDLGAWCLHCAGLYDPQVAGWELSTPEQQTLLRQQGYVTDTPAPAVRHLDGLVAALATAEIHNLVHTFKPQQRYLVYDALKSELVPLRVTPGHDCPVCSPDHGVLGLGDLEPLPDYRRAAQVKLPPLLNVGSNAASSVPDTTPAPAAALSKEPTFPADLPALPDTFPLPSREHFQLIQGETPTSRVPVTPSTD